MIIFGLRLGIKIWVELGLKLVKVMITIDLHVKANDVG